MQKFALPLLFSTLACQAAPTTWHPFDWYTASFEGGAPERLALMLPAVIDGKPCRVQLDTGANGEWIWHGPALGKAQHFITVEIGGVRKSVPADPDKLAMLTRKEYCEVGAAAIVGNAYFEQGTLTLDLRSARFAYSPQALLAQRSDAHPLLYLSWAEGGGHTVVEVRQDNGKLGYALLDTGATRFGLAATSGTEWTALTGGMALAASPTVRQYQINSWGKPVTCYETAMPGAIEVGGKQLRQALASYCVDQGFKSPVKLIGVLGLKPLGSSTVTLDYLSRRWLLSD